MSAHREIPQANVALGAALTDVAQINVGGVDALILDIENKGSAAVTSWMLLARVSSGAPFRDVTPASLKSADGFLVIRAAKSELSALGAGQFLQVSLNVSMYDAVLIRAAGLGAQLVLQGGGLS